MIAKVDIKFKKEDPNIIVIIDESVYDVPLKYVKVIITIPGYEESKSVTISTNKVTRIDSEYFGLKRFPDGLYNIVADFPDCVFEIDLLNTTELDGCIDKKIKELAECNPDYEQIKILNHALIQRSYSKQLDCNSIAAYQLARKLACKDCH